MKQSLQLRLGHHLAMTPQLQQAIRLLQLSTLELHTEIQQVLEANPMLEALDEENSTDGEFDSGATAPSAPLAETAEEANQVDNSPNVEEQEVNPDWLSQSIPEELPVDSAWEDLFDAGPAGSTPPPDDDNREMVYQDRENQSLKEHLLWQVGLSNFSENDAAIAAAIVDSIDEDGYFKGDLLEIHQSLSSEYNIDPDEIEPVLHRIQKYDPPGVGARNLKECLLLQLALIDTAVPWKNAAKLLVEQHLDLLANHDYNQLMRKMRLSQAELADTISLILTLNPRPGGQITSSTPEYVVPDVFVKKQKGKWRVELNPDAMPRLRINGHYASLIKRAHNNNDNNYMKGQLQEARWFIKSLQSRNETLLKVATCIVEQQRGFLEHGEEAMRALVLHNVAESVGMHESTISRVTTRKYMHTPRGIFELKYFFSSHVSTSNGGECSATAIRAFIKKMVADENPGKPLSDNKIATLLSDKGIEVARRTIAKYREGMSIPPSNERKRLVRN